MLPWKGEEEGRKRKREEGAGSEREEGGEEKEEQGTGGGEGRERERERVVLLYTEEPLGEGQPSPWARKFRVGGRVRQVGTEGCWENLEARSTFISKRFTSTPCFRYETKHKTKQKGVFLRSGQVRPLGFWIKMYF